MVNLFERRPEETDTDYRLRVIEAMPTRFRFSTQRTITHRDADLVIPEMTKSDSVANPDTPALTPKQRADAILAELSEAIRKHDELREREPLLAKVCKLYWPGHRTLIVHGERAILPVGAMFTSTWHERDEPVPEAYLLRRVEELIR